MIKNDSSLWRVILVLMSFLNEKGYNFKMSNYGGFFVLFFLCVYS